MKKVFRFALACMMSASLLAGCSAKPQQASSVSSEKESEESGTVTIVDHADRTVTVKKNPKKAAILSILPLPAMLTVYLNSAETIVAMEPASMTAAENGILSELFPEIRNVSTDIMNGDDVNVEALLKLEPDVVFFNAGNKKEQEVLENAGLTAVGVSPTKWEYNCIETYNQWMDLLNQIYPAQNFSGKQDLINKYAADRLAEITEKTKDVREKQKVLFLFQYDDKTMITSSAKFFGQWWCDAVGAENVAHDVPAENSNAKISMEQVYTWNPDVIIITNFTKTGPDDLYNNKIGSDDWSGIRAVQDKRVYKMPLGTYRTYTPGVDTPMTLEWLAQAVYPDLFKDYDIRSDVKDYYKELYDVTLSDEQVDKMYTPNTAAGDIGKIK